MKNQVLHRQEVLRSSRTAPQLLRAKRRASEAAGHRVRDRDDACCEVSREPSGLGGHACWC